MEPKKIFRACVLATVALYVFLHTSPYDLGFKNDEAALDLLAWDGYKTVLPFSPWTANLMLFGYMVIAVGLWFTQKWGRTGLVAYVVFETALTSLYGIRVINPVFAIPGTLGWTLLSMILAACYLPPMADEFRRSRQSDDPAS